MEVPKGPFCQSCAMPMEKPEDFGTEAGGSSSPDYCHFCYQGGKFTDSDRTMEGMIDFVSKYMTEQMKMPEAQARGMMTQFIPTLKRWKK